MRPPGIRTLLLGVNASVLVIPVVAAVALRVYDNYLVRQTERQLIAQAVVIGEIWRELWRDEALGPARDRPTPAEHRPPHRAADRFIPIEPVTSLADGVLPPQTTALRPAADTGSAAWRAGRRLVPVLERAQVFNLTAVRVLDAQGCVVATTRGEAGLCMEALPEVQRALGGAYAAVVRERVSDEPLPPLSDVRSRGSVRVFSALPVFSDGAVIGVVRVSRTSLDALTSLWQNRRGLVFAAALTLLATVLVSLVFATIIARPLRELRDRARTVAQGGAGVSLAIDSFAPAELHELGAALRTMTERLRGRAQYITDFAANVSHELKTPLTSIHGAAELLRESWASMDAAQRERFLENIGADATRMERLVMRLLHLTRIETAGERSERVSVREFFRELEARYAGRVRVTLEGSPEHVDIDIEHLHAAVTNLVDNALQHGGRRGDGGSPVEITVGRTAERLSVRVRDFGPGISLANRPRIFERFFTTDRARGGTGLGLSIVKAIADRRGGSVTFETGPTGTTFVLVL